jgi:TctA family transporter
MLRVLEHRLGAREGRIGVDEVGGRIDGAADLAVVAVLVLGVALGALALDEAVGQEHVLLGVEELLDGARLDQAVGLEVQVDLLR